MIRDAILAASPIPPGFPLDALQDSSYLQQLRVAPHLQQFLNAMHAEAERARNTPLERLSFSLFNLFEETGDRAAFERGYFDRRRRLAGLTLTTVIDETEDYQPSLSDLIWEICGEYTWCLPAHLPVGIDQVEANRVPPEQVVDLFSAHTAHMLAEVVVLLGDRLPRWLHYRVRTEIERRVFQPVFGDPRQFWWESAAMNWAAVCGGCIGMAALILEADRERLAGMIDRVVRTVDCFLDGFGSDGGCPEGIGYWAYGFGFYTYFADALSRFTGGQLDLLDSERFKRIATFPQVVSLGGGQYINFSDAPQRVVIHPGMGSRLAGAGQPPIPELQPPDFHADHCYRWGHITRDLIWTDPALLEAPVAEGAFYLHDLAWVVDRRIPQGSTIAFAAKGGHNDEPHNHNDLGHFIIHIGGETLLVDLGAGVYTRQYFREARYDSLHTGSHGHSVPIVNGKPQRDGAAHVADVVSYETRSDGMSYTLDLTRAYDDADLKQFTRAFDWSVDSIRASAALRITDTFRFNSPDGLVEECFISLTKPLIERDSVVWNGERGKITMQFDADAFSASVETLETQMHHGDAVIVHRVSLRPRQVAASYQCAVDFHCELLPS